MTTHALFVGILHVLAVFACFCIIVNGSPIEESIQSSCSGATHLQHRISQALHAQESHGQIILPFTLGLHGVIDDVLTLDECRTAVTILKDKFLDTSGSGYSNNIRRPEGFYGVDLIELSHVTTRSEYQTLLEFRRRVKDVTERALNLCPDTLFVHFTHFTKKTVGGMHGVHADNCFVTEPWTQDDPSEEQREEGHAAMAVCPEEGRTSHPYPSRIVSSILYLDDNFVGGEFYWADRTTGQPIEVVKPKAGRMMSFTSGPECLHGALPVTEPQEGSSGSGMGDTRLAIAMWYVVDRRLEERIPQFAGTDEVEEDIEAERRSKGDEDEL